MMLYMDGFGNDKNSPADHNKFDAKVAELQNTYTNYGCYCWIDGAGAGVIGGGKTKDMTDHHCKEPSFPSFVPHLSSQMNDSFQQLMYF